MVRDECDVERRKSCNTSASVCCLGCFLNLVASLKDINDILDCIGGDRLSDAVVKEGEHILANLHMG